MLKVALSGYGKMGKMLAQMAPNYDIQVCATIDPSQAGSFPTLTAESLAEAEVCIDFTHPAVVLENIRTLAALGKTMVIGTTGWHAHLEDIRPLADQYGIGIVYGANFSIGMNLFNRVVAYATELFDKFADYDVWGMEMHHNQKADSPSGTAILLAETVLAHSIRKNKANYERMDGRIAADELHFPSLRAGSIPGTHTIGFDSEADSVELTHRARSRAGFASGALLAAKWIAGKKGFYSFNDMMENIVC